MNTERLWSHSTWSSQDPHGCLLIYMVGEEVWESSVSIRWLGTRSQGKFPLSEPRVSILTAPTSCPLPISAQSLVLSVLGSFLRAKPAQILLPFPMPVTVTVMGERTDGSGLHVDHRDKST